MPPVCRLVDTSRSCVVIRTTGPIGSARFRRSISWLMQKIRMSLSKIVASPLADGWISTNVSPLT